MQTHSLAEFQEEAVRFAGTLGAGDSATIVALLGELGAGKTAFTQTLAKHFGVEESVASPTFVIQKAYDAKGSFKRFIHIDAYRLKSAQELEALGWAETMSDAGNLIVIEWPERVTELIPADAHRIALEFVDEDTRNIEYDR